MGRTVKNPLKSKALGEVLIMVNNNELPLQAICKLLRKKHSTIIPYLKQLASLELIKKRDIKKAELLNPNVEIRPNTKYIYFVNPKPLLKLLFTSEKDINSFKAVKKFLNAFEIAFEDLLKEFLYLIYVKKSIMNIGEIARDFPSYLAQNFEEWKYDKVKARHLLDFFNIFLRFSTNKMYSIPNLKEEYKKRGIKIPTEWKNVPAVKDIKYDLDFSSVYV